MADTVTYTPIATNTLSSPAASVTFSSIPGTYKDLVLVMNVAVTDGSSVMRVNNDGTFIYSRTQMSGTGTVASSGSTSTDDGWFPVTGTTGFTSVTTVHLMNYSNTTTYKTALARGNNASSVTQASAWLYRSTSAITQINIIKPNTDNFITGSTFTLYGIGA